MNGVSFVCPVCEMLCGYNEKKKTTDAVQVASTRENWLQYAHANCADSVESARNRAPARPLMERMIEDVTRTREMQR